MSLLSGDGRFSLRPCGRGDWYFYSTETAESRKIIGLLPGEEPISGPRTESLYVRSPDELRPGEQAITTRVYRLDPHTGRRELWKEIRLSVRRGAEPSDRSCSRRDGKTCVYTHHRYSSELFLAEGLK